MLNFKKLTTRELVHNAKKVQEALERGESFVWTSRGKTVGYIQPATAPAAERGGHDWMSRARAAGATVAAGQDLSRELSRQRS